MTSPFYMMLFTLFSLPFYVVRFTIFGLPTTVLEIALALTIAAWMIGKIRTKTFSTIPFVWRAPVLLFFIASVIAIFTTPKLIPALGHWRAFILEPMLFTFILIDTVKTDRDRSLVVYALATSLVIPVAVALYQQVTGNLIPNEFWADAATRRVTSIYGYPNALGLYAVPVLILILGSIFNIAPTVIPAPYRGTGQAPAGIQKKKEKANRLLFIFFSRSPIKSGMTMRRILLTLLFLATTSTIFFTRSKGALIALAAGIAAYAIINAKKKLLTTAMIAAIVMVGIIIFKDSFNLRGFSTVQGGDSVSVRLTQYRETWAMLKDRPLTGAGLRGYQTAVVPYHTQEHIEIFMYPHNLFLAVWSELGLLGLVAFIWIIIQFFTTSFHSTKLTNYTYIAAMVALLVHGLVDVPYFKNDLAILFWALIVLPIVDYKTVVRQNQKKVV